MTKTPSRFASRLVAAAALAVAMPPHRAAAQILQFNDAAEVAAAHMGVERVAHTALPVYRAWADRNNETKWVQIDLGSEQMVDSIKLVPSNILWGLSYGGFPAAYRLEVSHDADFKTPILIDDKTLFENNFYPIDEVVTYAEKQVRCRYVRLTATQLRNLRFCLSRIMVFSGGRDIAVGCRATDSDPSRSKNLETLTKPHRPDGEFVVYDHPENVIPEKKWRPVKNVVETPLTGIKLKPSVLQTALQNNINYLLHSFTKEELVRNFKEKAGLPCAPLNPQYNRFWWRLLPGAEAGRFLMGAGNTLRWQEHKPLRDEMNYIINVIDSCKEPDGWLMAYQKHEIFNGEYGAYTRSWVTHGLIDAGYGGNEKAFPLLRGFYDYMDRSPFLREMLRRCIQGPQGVIPFTRTYFSPVGKPEDLKVVMRYFQQNFFMEGLAARNPDIIWRYPYDRPHDYLLTAIEPYFDLYRATGAKKYLDAVQGAWDLYHDNWETTGGVISICEGEFLYEPKSNWLHKKAGELCGNAFWIKLNQRFHNLYPEEEKYVAEIEKSIYNAFLANQYGPEGIRYYTILDRRKAEPKVAGTPHAASTCCEGQGTRIYGSLPEYVYSFAKDGLYVDLYSASTVSLPVGGQEFALDVSTQFPYSGSVAIKVTSGARAKLRLRIPAWAGGDVAVSVNGGAAAQGRPGTYCTIDRAWQAGDVVSFSLPLPLRTTLYTGLEPGFEHNCYAIEMGPVLMATVAVNGSHEHVRLPMRVDELAGRLRPVEGRSLHFAIEGAPGYELWPYFEVGDEPFSCFPQFN